MTELDQPIEKLSEPIFVLAADGNYAMPLTVTLVSLVQSNTSLWPVNITVMCDSFSAHQRQKVIGSLPSGSAQIVWIEINLREFGGYYTAPGVTAMTFARLLIPEKFPDAISKVIYLDTDLLILGNLSRLWSSDLQGNVVGAVRDSLDAQIKQGRNVDGIASVPNYFNAGVLVIDLDRWRSEKISSEVVDYLAKNPNTPYMDQDGLNYALDGRWQELDSEWNFQDHYETSFAACNPKNWPAIVHFVTSLKPWKATSISVNSDFYDGFRCQTLFSRSMPERISDYLVSLWYVLKRRLRRVHLLNVVWKKVIRRLAWN